MINRFKTYIEKEPWEEQALHAKKHCNGAAWLVILIAALYFGPVCLRILLR